MTENDRAGTVVSSLITLAVFPWLLVLAASKGGKVWGVPATLTVLSVWLFTWSSLSVRISTWMDKVSCRIEKQKQQQGEDDADN